MTTIHELRLSKKQLDRIPDAERLFYFMAGQLSNDVNILTKFLTFSINEAKSAVGEPPKRSAAIAQVILVLKFLAGRLYEGHKMINETFSAKKFRKKYAAEMTPVTIASLDDINKYFGPASLIQRIRRKFAFHMDASEIEKVRGVGLALLPPFSWA